MKKKSILKRSLSCLLCVLALLAGTAFIFNEQLSELLLEKTGEQYQLTNISKEDIKKNEKKSASFAVAAVHSVDSVTAIKDQFAAEELPVIGAIAVPSVMINLPIFKGLSDIALLYGAGTLAEDQKMGVGNYCLASHRSPNKTVRFTPLDNVKTGSYIYVTDLSNVYVYVVTVNVKVDTSQTQYLENSEDSKLTLITCGDSDGISRRVVQGKLNKVIPMEKADNTIVKAFSLPQNKVNTKQ